MGCCIQQTADEYPAVHRYLAKIDTSLNSIWAYDFGINGPKPNIITTKSNGDIFILGFLSFSADFDHSQNSSILTNSGYGFLIKKLPASKKMKANVIFAIIK